MAKLSGMSGDFKGREFPIEQGENTIGRKSDNRILLDHPTISSHHCRILYSGDSCVLQDLDSTNGTRVNSRDVKETSLHHKDLIQLGSIEFLFDAPELAADGARYTDADIELANGTMHAPEDFASISPFGARPRARRQTWFIVLAITGLVAIFAVVFFTVMLLSVGGGA
ncbi:MAG: FHA domain-containing protein [Lentisphaerae bacterium]|jgi:predicted component of type VI protein secretion system|nr:FHA domain-containing protein [Lentisphaerota bacterium]